MTARLPPATVASLLAGVADADAAVRRDWPGAPATRQPVQVLYVPADRVTASIVADVGAEAGRLLAAHAPDAATLARVCAVPAAVGERVREQVAAKLAGEPLEDLRVDFEDGYGDRGDAAEDRDAEAAAAALAAAARAGALPPFVGLRVKPFGDGAAARSVATLDRFLGAFLDRAGGLPAGFVVTFPKVVASAHLVAFADVLAALEDAHGLPAGRLRVEVQIETTQSLLGPDGRVALRDLRIAARGRLCGAHVGVYDYTAALGLPPGEQRLDAPALDLLRQLLQVTFAGTEVRLADGSTNAVPADDSSAAVQRVWTRHAADVRHSLRAGYVQGWDLHPAHLVSRYATVFAFLLDGLDDVLERLARWQRGDVGDVMDEPATVTALRAQVQRAVDCGAVPATLVRERTGADVRPRPAADAEPGG